MKIVLALILAFSVSTIGSASSKPLVAPKTVATSLKSPQPAKPTAQDDNPPHQCDFTDVSKDFSLTYKGKALVVELVRLLKDFPMSSVDRNIEQRDVFAAIDTAVTAWCTAHNAKAKH